MSRYIVLDNYFNLCSVFQVITLRSVSAEILCTSFQDTYMVNNADKFHLHGNSFISSHKIFIMSSLFILWPCLIYLSRKRFPNKLHK
jgi:hypothetical protein